MNTKIKISIEGDQTVMTQINTFQESEVKLVDRMGDDYRVLQAARISTGADAIKGEAKDRGLIRHLYRNQHLSPFEQVVFTFHLKMPIFVMRQVVRHRTAKLNEVSGRYRKLNGDFFLPTSLRLQNTEGNKQGSHEWSLSDPRHQAFLDQIEGHFLNSWRLYEDMESSGVANELARIVLPVALYTEVYWTMDLRNLLHFIELRMDSHAQPEIQDLARKMVPFVKEFCPWTWEAFEDFTLHAKNLDVGLLAKVKSLVRNEPLSEVDMAQLMEEFR